MKVKRDVYLPMKFAAIFTGLMEPGCAAPTLGFIANTNSTSKPVLIGTMPFSQTGTPTR